MVNKPLEKAKTVRFLGEIESSAGTVGGLRKSGEYFLVVRGRPRNIVMLCPCGCGQQIVINLDSRAGPAWRLYWRNKKATVHPSIWRETGCKSHFVIWNDKVFAFEYDEDWSYEGYDAALDDRIQSFVQEREFSSYQDISDELGELPWTILVACRRLATKGILEEGSESLRGFFRRGSNQRS